MRSEVADLARTLAWTANTIAQADPVSRIRIAAAYREAQCLVAPIAPTSAGSRRSRILACFERFTPLKEVEDIAACGWMLAAIQERVSERNLPGWEDLDQVVETAVRLLQYGAPRLH